jgi:hypothetical protein
MQNIVADMRKVLAKNPQVEQQKLHRRVFLEDINPENTALKVSVCSVHFVCVCFTYMTLSIARNDRNIVYVDRKIQADLVK